MVAADIAFHASALLAGAGLNYDDVIRVQGDRRTTRIAYLCDAGLLEAVVVDGVLRELDAIAINASCCICLAFITHLQARAPLRKPAHAACWLERLPES